MYTFLMELCPTDNSEQGYSLRGRRYLRNNYSITIRKKRDTQSTLYTKIIIREFFAP